MNKTVKQTMMAAVAITLGLCASLVQAQAMNSVYVIDSRGEVAMSGAGLCWRTGFWTPAAAATDKNGCKCDKDLIAKEICEPASTAGAGAKKSGFGEKITLAADALFDFNKAVLRAEGKAKLDDVIAKSNQLVLEVVIAVGHADRIGSPAYNQKLSEKRAAAVKDYLVAKGIPANRVYTEGKGSKQPVTKPAQCKGAKSAKVIACLQPDRRVDIEIIGTKK
jgi:OOP family OmpA-OmpF porin